MCSAGFRKTFLVAGVFCWAASAQNVGDALKSTITGVHYGPLAEAARVQGDVRLNVNSGRVTVVSGHPLLAQTAVENAKALGSMAGTTNLDLTYHFVLADTTTSKKIKRGNAFERVVLRMFGLQTETMVCEEGVAPPNDVKIAGPVIDIWIYGRSRCIETETTVVAKR
jgi:hypothetical protein